MNRTTIKQIRSRKLKYGSGSKVWWKCYKGHEWEITANKRFKGTGFPFCAGKQVSIDTSILTMIKWEKHIYIYGVFWTKD